MKQTEDFELQLHEHYIVAAKGTFVRARQGSSRARDASRSGNCAESDRRPRSVRMPQAATAEWRQRARQLTPAMACSLLCLLGCSKEPTREFSARFEVEPTDEGRGIMWSLRLSTQEYHQMIEATDRASEDAKVHELVAAGFRLHHIVGCSTQEKSVIRLDDGSIAYIGACAVAAHGTQAGAI